MNTEQLRDEFEADLLERLPTSTFGRFPISGQYNNDWIEHQWVGYQAGRADMQSQVESAKHKPISVDEQLPERSKESSAPWSDKVIAYTKDGNQLMAFYDHDHKEWEDVECIKLDDVTHWLPLPRLP